MKSKSMKKRFPRSSSATSKRTQDKKFNGPKKYVSKRPVLKELVPKRIAPKKTVAKKAEPEEQEISLTTSLSKFIAVNGVCSRRKAVEFIKEGKVTINNKIVYEPGRKVADDDHVCVNSIMVQAAPKMYILLNKPKDYIATASDERGRKTIMELIPEMAHLRLYPVGRLDRSTTGLLVLTNDGELAQRLSHPKYEISKIYEVVLDIPMKHSEFKTIVDDGVELEDGHVTVDTMAILPGENKRVVMVELHSGKNRVVRRIFEHYGYKVRKLDRVEYAGLTKRDLRVGQWRNLTQHEVRVLKGASVKK